MARSAPRRSAFLVVAACALVSVWRAPAAADFAVSYKVKSATLELFDKPQPSPFGAVNARIMIKGERVRVEATDLWGTTHTWISDRGSHTTWRLLPNQQYTTEAGSWACQGLPIQVAAVLAEGLARAGIDSVSITGPTSATWQTRQSRLTQWAFRARVFGMPKPVWVNAQVYFPAVETDFFTPRVVELYCGKKPPEAEWQSAFQQMLELSKEGAGALAQVAGLPMALDLSSDLGMGQATLVLEATDFSASELEAALFQIPAGFKEAPRSE